jgi:putative hydrolase of the HAD superfamily
VRSFHERHRAELRHADPGEFQAAWSELAERTFDRYLAGELGFQEQRRERLRALYARELSDAEADALYADYYAGYRAAWRLFPDALPCLDALEHAGIGMGLVSNGDGPSQRDKIAVVKLDDRLDPIVVSGELGLHKPDPRVFHEACRRAGRAPAECLYVGDRLESDARGAAAAGLKGVWLDRSGAGGDPEGVTTIRSLAEVPALAGIGAERG